MSLREKNSFRKLRTAYLLICSLVLGVKKIKNNKKILKFI